MPTWYAVDIRNLKENTIGNGTLTIRNLDNSPVVAKAEISWVCPVEHEMTYRQQTIAGVHNSTLSTAHVYMYASVLTARFLSASILP